jgi:hypothetical protein
VTKPPALDVPVAIFLLVIKRSFFCVVTGDFKLVL